MRSVRPVPHRAAASRRVPLVAVLVLTVLLALPVAAAAHGSLVVPTVRLDAEDRTVTLQWTAAEDDAAAIAVGLGLAPREALLDHLAALAALDDGDDPQPLIDQLIAQVDQDRLTGAPELDAYLLAGMTVAQDEVPCSGGVGPTDDFLSGTAALSYTCPDPIDEIDLTVTILLEQDPTHRTFSNDGRGEVALHSAVEPTQTWALASGGGPAGTGALLPLVVGLLAAAATGVAAFRLLGRGGAPDAGAVPRAPDPQPEALRAEVAP